MSYQGDPQLINSALSEQSGNSLACLYELCSPDSSASCCLGDRGKGHNGSGGMFTIIQCQTASHSALSPIRGAVTPDLVTVGEG